MQIIEKDGTTGREIISRHRTDKGDMQNRKQKLLHEKTW